jgi:hypothetical protein
MEIPMGLMAGPARFALANIASECGYLVSSNGRSTITVSGGDIPGYVVLDWFDSDRPGPIKIEHWESSECYTQFDKARGARP